MEENKNRNFILKLTEYILFIVFYFAFELVLYGVISNFAFPTYMILDIVIILALGIPVFFTKNTVFDRIYLFTLMFIIGVLVGANVTFYSCFGDIFSLYNLAFAKQGMAIALNPAWFRFDLITLLVVIYACFVTLVCLANKYIKEPVNEFAPRKSKPVQHKKFLVSLALFVSCFSLYGISQTIVNNNQGEQPLREKIITMSKRTNFKKYGMLSYYIQELDYLLNGAPLLSDAEMINYFSLKQEHDNDYTGLLEGKNVFVIMVETGDDLMINETLTPNMYKLTQDSLYCTNNYSKNKTNVSEFIGMVGTAPTSGIWGQNEDQHYVLPFSSISMLDDTYNTMYFHDVGTEEDNDTDIYSRYELMPKLGFDEIYFHEQLCSSDEPIWSWNGDYTFDSITMPKVADNVLSSDEPFYAFYTSLGMHGPYCNRLNQDLLEENYGDELTQAKENGDWINVLEARGDEENAPALDAYMMCAMDFDKGLGDLFARFEEAGKMDDTLFVIYGDHELYYTGYDGNPLSLTIAEHEENSFYDIYSTVLFFKNDDLVDKYRSANGSNQVNFFTSPLDIVPTTLDLLGIDYNNNFYMGDSLFSVDENDVRLFYSLELGAFFNEYYWASNDTMVEKTFVTNPPYSEEVFLKEVSDVMDKQAYMDIIYTNDYFYTRDFNDYLYYEEK